MRPRLLSAAFVAILVLAHAPVAIAKENDRLAQKLAEDDEGANPSGGYSGGEFGWGDGEDGAGDDGDLLRGINPDGGDGGGSEEGGACFDTGEGEPVCVAPAGPSDVASLDTLTKYDLCTGCIVLSAVSCPVVGVLCAGASAITVGGLTIPCATAILATCVGAVGGMATCHAMCS